MPSEVWFALTLSLSPRRGNLPALRWEKSLNREPFPGAEEASPSPGGEGRGEGERLIELIETA